MRCRYYNFLIGLFLIFAVVIILLKKDLQYSNWITTSATLVATFAALSAGVIALGVADKPPRFIKFEVETEIDKQNIEPYNPEKLPNELKKHYANDTFYSYRVYFKIKNKSKFTLKKPVITFRLPTDLTHPRKISSNRWIRDYRSNFFNAQIDLRTLQYGNTIVLSNNILPYLNDNQELPIWIRMCLMDNDMKPRQVYVDLNCENAEGATKEARIIPNRLLRDLRNIE